ncbi:MAG: HAD family hydrolase [Candidatus Nanosalina sp.]
MKYDAVIFDLDGTLLESTADRLEWLYTAVEKAIEKFDMESEATELSHRELGTLAGLEGDEKFREKCMELGLDADRFWFHVSHMRAKEKLHLLDENLLGLVNGTEEVLEDLRSENISLAVVSNAPDPTVDEVVRFFELDQLLDFFRGITDLKDFRERKPHPFHLEMAIAELEADNILYVGDSHVDVIAAEKAGADSVIIGEDREADFTVENLTEIPVLIQS